MASLVQPGSSASGGASAAEGRSPMLPYRSFGGGSGGDAHHHHPGYSYGGMQPILAPSAPVIGHPVVSNFSSFSPPNSSTFHQDEQKRSSSSFQDERQKASTLPSAAVPVSSTAASKEVKESSSSSVVMSSSSSSHHSRPVPMKLFATWEVDRTPPNCIPRLCSLTLARLVLNKSLGSDLTSVIIAVKMQSSKRTLRSNEIELPTHGLLDTKLELTFSLQYPHFLKRDGNQLHIMLQRRKKYKNRTILGFKTLAAGTINMSQALQKQLDLELELFGDVKEKSGMDRDDKDEKVTAERTERSTSERQTKDKDSSGNLEAKDTEDGKKDKSKTSSEAAVGKVYLLSLSSQPVDHEEATGNVSRNKSAARQIERDRELMYSDDDDDFSSGEEGSDSEPMLDDSAHQAGQVGQTAAGGSAAGASSSARRGVSARSRKTPRNIFGVVKNSSRSGGQGQSGEGQRSSGGQGDQQRQRNLKQKIVSMLKKFKVTDPDDLENEQVSLDQKLSEGSVDPAEIEDLFDQLEDLSDSGPDVDTISIGSTPKPSLKPFFNSSRNLHFNNPAAASSGANSQQSSQHQNAYGVGIRGGSGSTSKDQQKNQRHRSYHQNDFGGLHERFSDDSSKEGISDSHPDTLTDPEYPSDNQNQNQIMPTITADIGDRSAGMGGATSGALHHQSPPNSGDEIKAAEQLMALQQSAGKSKPDKHDRRSQLFSRLPASPFSNKDQANSSTSGQQAQNSSSTMNAEAAENPEVVVVKGSSRIMSESPSFLADAEASETEANANAGNVNGNQNAAAVSTSMASNNMTSSLATSNSAAATTAAPAPLFRGGSGFKLEGQKDQLQLAGEKEQPRKVLLEQLSRLLPSDSENLPDQLVLANTCDRQGAHVATKMAERGHRVICTASPADVRATLTCLVSKIQKFCNTKTESPPSAKIVLIGSDLFINSVLRPYVEMFSSKPPDWQSYLKFFIIPLGVNNVSRYIGCHDPIYSSLFLHDSWKELVEKAEPGKSDVGELVSRIIRYISSAEDNLVYLPIAEAMVTYKEKSLDRPNSSNAGEESCQVFVPFVSDVWVGSDSGPATGIHSIDLEDESNATAGSAKDENRSFEKEKFGDRLTAATTRLTPPNSPAVGKDAFGFGGGRSAAEFFQDSVGLQLDYWVQNSDESDGAAESSRSSSNNRSMFSSSGGAASLSGQNHQQNSAKISSNEIENSASGSQLPGGGNASQIESNSGLVKNSIKTQIRFMLVQKSPSSLAAMAMVAASESNSHQQPASSVNVFAMQYWTKEKKQKMMRLGKKKEKDGSGSEVKSQSVDGITRLICLSKAQTPLRVHIDGTEWQGVKFFQLSSQWQTHIKHFPIATFISTQTNNPKTNQTSL